MEGSVATTPPTQGAPAPAQAQASAQGAGGQGQPTGQGQGSGFNWGLFPSVPEGQRELLQPHLTNVLGHVTRMEQQMSPYKGLMEFVQPDQAQNLLQFLQNYSQDPLATFMGLAQSLKDDGTIQGQNFSVDALQALVNEAQGPAPGTEDMPPWAQQFAQQMQSINGWIEQQAQTQQQNEMQEQQRQNEAMLSQAYTTIREQLTQAGISNSEAFITDAQLQAGLIAHQGDITQVIQAFTQQRDGFLGDFTRQNGQSGAKPPPTVNGKTPEAPKGGLRGRKGDSFRDASIGAQQMLSAAAAAEGQGN